MVVVPAPGPCAAVREGRDAAYKSKHAAAVRPDRAPIGGRCRCRRDRPTWPASRPSRGWGIARGNGGAPRGRRATAQSRDRQNRRTGSTRRILALGTSLECPASARSKRSSREGGQGSSARDSALGAGIGDLVVVLQKDDKTFR